MNTTIRFPHLGLTLNPGKSINILGIDVAYYGIVIGCAMLIGTLLILREAKKTKQNVDDYIDFMLYVIIAAIVGARLYYVIFEWDYFSKNLLEIFNLRGGGLAIYGGVIASAITLLVFAKVKKLNFWLMADTGIQGLIIGQIIGRLGNFFNRECFGGYTDSILAMQLPVSEAKGITAELLEKLVEIDGIKYIQVHPTFLYEMLWNLGVYIIMCLYRRKKKVDGEVLAIYCAGYGIGRFIIEGMRTDQLVIKGLGIAASQVVSIIMIIIAITFVIYKRRNINKSITE